MHTRHLGEMLLARVPDLCNLDGTAACLKPVFFFACSGSSAAPCLIYRPIVRKKRDDMGLHGNQWKYLDEGSEILCDGMPPPSMLYLNHPDLGEHDLHTGL
jgi:hypothetical protein